MHTLDLALMTDEDLAEEMQNMEAAAQEAPTKEGRDSAQEMAWDLQNELRKR